MKIETVRFNEETGRYRVVLVGPSDLQGVVVSGVGFRCGAYRWCACEPVQHYGTNEPAVAAVAVDFAGPNEPQAGMVVHPDLSRLLDEEVSSSLQHLLMLPRLLMGIDAAGLCDRITVLGVRGQLEPDPGIAQSVEDVRQLASVVAELTARLLPLARYAEAARLKPELLRVLCRE